VHDFLFAFSSVYVSVSYRIVSAIYGEKIVENRNLMYVYLTPILGVTHRNFIKIFGIGKSIVRALTFSVHCLI